MKIMHRFLLAILVVLATPALAQEPVIVPTNSNSSVKQPAGGMTEQPIQEGDLSYTTVPNDPTKTRVYTLANGLTVYLSVNKDEPRIQTYVAVRAGSKMDPAETTGLAHYLEHMLFKGTEQIGTQNWKSESLLLEQISKLYEQHRQEKDPEKKELIYAEIDRVSGEAAKLAIPNEYDKMLSSMGAKGTNAWTSHEQTVYTNDIPSNELTRWAELESQRFQTLVLRLFHTELEAVYEEYNMSQDRDSRKLWKAMFEVLYPDHPYGTQTTIGEGEHLKNPSMVNIERYFNRYYVPGNMAICLAGDLDPDKAIEVLNQTFGRWQQKEVHSWKKPAIQPLKGVHRREVSGLEAESIMIAFRLPGADPYQSAMARLIDGLLSNGQAGLMDLDLVQAQKVLGASSYFYELADYSAHIFSAQPREGQTLEELEDLILAEILRIKSGDFPQWLLDAVVNDYQLQETRRFESNRGRTNAYASAFTLGMSWADYLNRTSYGKRMTKATLVDFANTMYDDDYVVIYKRRAEDPSVSKVEKPAITPIEANREAVSPYVNRFMKQKVADIDPVFVDYKDAIEDSKLASGIPFSYIRNQYNDLFTLTYVLDMGGDNDALLPHAINYLPYLGVDTADAASLAQAFFRLGLSFDVSSGRDRVNVTLRGLGDNLEAGLDLFEYVLAHAEADQKAWDDYVDGLMKERSDAKTSKSAILWRGMYDYARYDGEGPYRDVLDEATLRAVNPADLIRRIRQLTSYEHRVFYYGAERSGRVTGLLNRYHQQPKKLKKLPDAKAYEEASTQGNRVFFVHYDMVQAQVVMMAPGESFDKRLAPMADLFNAYFGSGLSSIVFQEIRETRALAYSAFASFTTPSKKEEKHWVRAFIATQADKLPEAIPAMQNLMNDMPEAQRQFDAARESVLKRIATDRITKSSIYWSREANARRGIKYDFRENVYNTVSDASLDDLNEFFEEQIADKSYTYLVLGDRNKLDMNLIRSLGDFQELTLEQIFGY